MGRLDIRVCAARHLPDTQWISKPDPYVKLKLEGQSHKTKALANQLNPEWNEVFKFQVVNPETAQLRIEVWNKNVLHDELMGHYTMSIEKLVRGEVVDKWHVLQQCRSHAEIRIRACAMDFGRAPDAVSTASSGIPAPLTPSGYPHHQQVVGYPSPQQASPQQPHQYQYPSPSQYGGYPPASQQPNGHHTHLPPSASSGQYPPQPYHVPLGGSPQQHGGYPAQQQYHQHQHPQSPAHQAQHHPSVAGGIYANHLQKQQHQQSQHAPMLYAGHHHVNGMGSAEHGYSRQQQQQQQQPVHCSSRYYG